MKVSTFSSVSAATKLPYLNFKRRLRPLWIDRPTLGLDSLSLSGALLCTFGLFEDLVSIELLIVFFACLDKRSTNFFGSDSLQQTLVYTSLAPNGSSRVTRLGLSMAWS